MRTPTTDHPVFYHPVIPLVTVRSMNDVDVIGDGLVDGGLPVAEVALRSKHAVDAIRHLSARGDVLVGAGTVLTVAQAEEALDAGARFVVTPGLDPDVVRHVLAAGVPIIPGVLTPTEVQAAARMGLNRVKLFPADAVDAAACLRAYASVYPAMRFMPSGGIELANVTRYLSFTSVFAVSGSWIPAVVHDGAVSVAGACRAAVAASEAARPR